ncbi:MAG: Uma2 family endonuclease [Gammaproteobacteria bacterium]|nr:Uma2 family endonuclease [Gammaproteobacteria bacterium]
MAVPAQAPAAAPFKAGYHRPRPGKWTYEDYLRLPDDGRRYEIIDGMLYMANAPGFDHQFTVSELHLQLGMFVKQRNLGIVLTAPFEIHLPGIAKPVQPDVFFIAKARQPQSGDKRFEGAPDLIVEVISPSSSRLDRVIKFSAYERAGVREYWLADPHARFVEVYALAAVTPHKYVLHGQSGEHISSSVFTDLALPVDSLFPRL